MGPTINTDQELNLTVGGEQLCPSHSIRADQRSARQSRTGQLHPISVFDQCYADAPASTHRPVCRGMQRAFSATMYLMWDPTT